MWHQYRSKTGMVSTIYFKVNGFKISFTIGILFCSKFSASQDVKYETSAQLKANLSYLVLVTVIG